MTQSKKVRQLQPQETNNKQPGMTHPITVWQPQPQETNNRKSGMTHPSTVWHPQPRQRNNGKIMDESHNLAQTVVNRGVIQDPPQEYKRAAREPSGNQTLSSQWATPTSVPAVDNQFLVGSPHFCCTSQQSGLSLVYSGSAPTSVTVTVRLLYQ